ncbi:ABC transporter permease subunit [Mycoplasmatota bacterium WC44]
MNIIKRELRSNLKSLLIWIGSIALIVFGASAEFKAFVDNQAMIEAMENFQYMFDALGVSLTNITTPEGFLSVMSLYLYLPLSIFAALLGSSIISKEERDKTAEYLFTLPVTRTRVLISKIIAAVINNLLFTIAVVIIAIGAFYRFEPTSTFYEFVGFLSIGLFLTQMIFMSIGMMLASILKQYKKSGSFTLGVLLGTFMLSILIGLSDKIEFLKYITPFQYFKVEDMLASKIDLLFLFLSIIIITSCISSVFVFFKKRDLYI